MPDKTEIILQEILNTLPQGWQCQQIYVGVNWTVSIVQNRAGQLRAGLAATPAPAVVAAHPRFRHGPIRWEGQDARELARWVQSSDQFEASLGLATVNALLQPDPARLQEIDAGDWLVEYGRGRKVAVVGRFPLANEELKAVVDQLWIFELKPQPGEHSPEEMAEIIPQADILAITSTSLINHTLGEVLSQARAGTKTILLGPSTPLSPVLFNYGINLLSGVQVVDLESLLASVRAGVSFRRVTGVRRVSLVSP